MNTNSKIIIAIASLLFIILIIVAIILVFSGSSPTPAATTAAPAATTVAPAATTAARITAAPITVAPTTVAPTTVAPTTAATTTADAPFVITLSAYDVGAQCSQDDSLCKNGNCGFIRTSADNGDYRCCENGLKTNAGVDYCYKALETGKSCRFDDECKNGNCKGNWSGLSIGTCN